MIRGFSNIPAVEQGGRFDDTQLRGANILEAGMD